MSEKRSPSTVTPIKKSMKHQKEKRARQIKEKDSRMKSFDTIFNGRGVVVSVNEQSGVVVIDGKKYNVDLIDEEGYFTATVENTHTYKIENHEGHVYLEGRLVDFTFSPTISKLKRISRIKEGESMILAPLPGTITEISVKIGEKVKVDQKILTLEAMKMQNDIMSEQDGYVKDIYVKKGELVSSYKKLVKISSTK